MDSSVGTIFKWDGRYEECEHGQCVGIVLTLDNMGAMVKWYDKCELHAEIDPNGTGPYSLMYLHKIGQLD